MNLCLFLCYVCAQLCVGTQMCSHEHMQRLEVSLERHFQKIFTYFLRQSLTGLGLAELSWLAPISALPVPW